MEENYTPKYAFERNDFMTSKAARGVRMLAEFSEPGDRFEKLGIVDTVVCFGSARTKSKKEALKNIKLLKKEKKVSSVALKKAEADLKMSRYYEEAVVLSRELSIWLKEKTDTFGMCSGGGPGIMEAVNKGAKQAGIPSIGLNINLPFEQRPNPYITPALNFDYNYFFLRKFWFLYLAKAIVIFPGGYGTLDEFMELLTLLQTHKITKDITLVLYGTEFWDKAVNFDYLVETGMIDKKDLKMFYKCDDVKDALDYMQVRLGKFIDKQNKRKETLNKRSFLR